MRCCPPATEPRVQNSGGGFGGHPRRGEGPTEKQAAYFLRRGSHGAQPPPGPRRTPTAALLRTFALTLRRERCSYRHCCRSACCSRATIAAKARSEARSRLFPVRQREITETPSGRAGLGGTAGNSGADRAPGCGELCSYCCASSSLVLLRNAPHENGAYGPTAETQSPKGEKKPTTTNPNKQNKSIAGFPPAGKSPCPGLEEPLAAAARHGTAPTRVSVGGTAQPRAAAAPGEGRHGAVTCPWSGGGCSASSGSSGSQGTGQPTAGAESSSGGGAAPTLRSPGTAHAQGGSAGHSRGGGRLAAGAGNILHGTGLRRARRPVKLRSAPAADGGSGTAPPRGTARAGRSGAEPRRGASGPCGGSRDVAVRGSFEGGRSSSHRA